MRGFVYDFFFDFVYVAGDSVVFFDGREYRFRFRLGGRWSVRRRI